MTSVAALSAVEMAGRIRLQELTATEVVEACLAQIDRLDSDVRAWVALDRDGALRTAQARDAEASAGAFLGPLHGVPVALKDIFDAEGLVTTSGAAAFAHRRPVADAESVARLRVAGAIVLGKTATTEFAYADPTETRNPWNLSHTPGGSSSGSAAAVAARMVPLALGSQTIGSTLRPAAYCGIVGMKPTYARISTVGVTPLSWSLDHVGIFARCVEDAALAYRVLAADESAGSLGDASAGQAVMRPRAPRLGIPRVLFMQTAGDEVAAHLDAVAARFVRKGAVVEDVSLPPSALRIHDAGQLVLRGDAAAYHAQQLAQHPESYRPRIKALVEEGLAMRATAYIQAQQARQRFRQEMASAFGRVDALLMPVAPGPAPRGLGSTGDPVLCAPWSFGGFPAIALPSGLSGSGLPLGIQLAAGLCEEGRLLEVARWCEACLAFEDVPAVA